MAYQASYRKYRPASFDEMVGQRQIVQTLKNAVETGRVSHAYLFCGPRGTGKTSVAKIFARVLNCESPDHKPCGKCENCKAENHPDIIEIDAASNNGVEEVRDLIERVKYAPMLGKYKVYIIDEVHMMTQGAFNALLKTIEEPPAHVIFILATTEPNKVLPTIISRTQRFDFKKISEKDIEGRLMNVAKQEGIDLHPDAASTIASLCQGGMRDALSILDQSISYAGDHISAQDVRAVYGVVSPDDIGRLFKNLSDHNMEDVISEIEQMYADGLDLTRFTADLISMLKNSLIYSFSQETSLLSDEEKERLEKWFSDASLPMRKALLKDLIMIYDKFRNAASVLDYLETVFLNFINYNDRETEISSNIPHSHDFISEKSEKSEKSARKAGSKARKKSDVSRETFSPSEKSQKSAPAVRYSDDELIGLLHIADKEIRKKDEEKWTARNELNLPIELKKYANLLRNCELVAAGTDFLIVKAPKPLASEINTVQDEEGFEAYTEKLLETPKALIAIPTTEYNSLIHKFVDCQKKGEFPAPPRIELKLKKEEVQASEEEELKKYFPDLQVMDD